jgi:hypothetical protein
MRKNSSLLLVVTLLLAAIGAEAVNSGVPCPVPWPPSTLSSAS